MRNRIITLALLVSGCLISVDAMGRHRQPQGSPSGAEIIDQMRAKYAALKSYSDTGTVTTEYAGPGGSGPSIVEQHTFTTYYRAPRQFFFEFVKDPKVGKERFVIWADGADFNTWWSATKVHDTYPKGRGATAFALATFPTKGSVMQIAPLLFAQAGLHGSIVDFTEPRLDGSEDIGGRRCYKVVGQVALAYGTGTVTSVRPTTIWIDAETLLVRRILEDTPSGTGASVDRVTTIFEPRADPAMDDAHFKFIVPT
jgi:outer membrane lipoprotein-sorting protein